MLAACTHAERRSAAAAEPLPSGLSQPFALLHLEQVDSIDNALIAAANRCMTQHGYPPRNDHADSTVGFIVTPADFGAMSDAQARRKGLRPGPVVSHLENDRPSQASSDAFGACVKAAEKRLPDSWQRLRERVADISNQMIDAFHAGFNPSLFAADKAEARCVVERGWTPARPNDVGSEQVSAYEVFGVPPGRTVVDRRAGTQTYIPSPREVDLALAMLHCRRDLGLPQKLLATAKRVQRPIAQKYEQQIAELNADIDAMARRAAAALK